MALAALSIFAAIFVFLLGYGVAIRVARRRPADRASRAAAAHDELERHLIALGAGLGVGA